jgi:hypothetical protein
MNRTSEQTHDLDFWFAFRDSAAACYIETRFRGKLDIIGLVSVAISGLLFQHTLINVNNF